MILSSLHTQPGMSKTCHHIQSMVRSVGGVEKEFTIVHYESAKGAHLVKHVSGAINGRSRRVTVYEGMSKAGAIRELQEALEAKLKQGLNYVKADIKRAELAFGITAIDDKYAPNLAVAPETARTPIHVRSTKLAFYFHA